MANVENMIANGVLRQDTENPEIVFYDLPVRLRKTAVTNDYFELFAGFYGWTKKIEVTDEQGVVTEINNPDSALKIFRQRVVAFIKEVAAAASDAEYAKTVEAGRLANREKYGE